MTFKNIICTVLGVIGAAISSLFGGWDAALTTLIIFMAIDYASGIIVAGVFHKSSKSDTGGLNSHIGWQGICRKGITLAIVLIACRLDLLIGTTYIKDAVIIAFCANELISIVENAGLMGLPIPNVITKAIDVLKEKSNEE
ncbi:MAG: phage holin family protein [Clostridia bacterium]|nr:phage holin family protein [Clostridia bacterium]